MSKPQHIGDVLQGKTELVQRIPVYPPQVQEILQRAFNNNEITLEEMFPRNVPAEAACRIRDNASTNNTLERQTQKKKPRRWFTQNPGKGKRSDFLPDLIQRDAAYQQKLTNTERKVYHALCSISSLTEKPGPEGYRRRYARCTMEELAGVADCGERTVNRAIKKILGSKLAFRHYTGTKFTGRSVYELPASYDQIIVWRAKHNGQH